MLTAIAMHNTILVVDDDEIIRNLLMHALSEHGFHVLTANSGYEALEFFKKNTSGCDLVVIDQSMPGMSGLEVCEEVISTMPSQKIIMTTGDYVSEEEIAEMKGKGINHVIRKPFNIIGLISLLKTELGCE